LRQKEFCEVSWFGGRGGISLFSFDRRRDFGGELIFDELSEGFVANVSLKLVPTALENSGNEIKNNLAKAFEEWNVFLPVVLYISIIDKIKDTIKRDFDVITIDFL